MTKLADMPPFHQKQMLLLEPFNKSLRDSGLFHRVSYAPDENLNNKSGEFAFSVCGVMCQVHLHVRGDVYEVAETITDKGKIKGCRHMFNSSAAVVTFNIAITELLKRIGAKI